jgi:hypothetical protein
MFLSILKWSIISLVLIMLIHYLYSFFKQTLTIPKTKDLVNRPADAYKEIYETIGNQQETNQQMKDELKNFLTNLNTNANTNANTNMNSTKSSNDASSIASLPDTHIGNMSSFDSFGKTSNAYSNF